MAGTITQLLSDLVSIRSVNPQLTGASATDGEQAVAHYVADFLAQRGVSVELQQVAPGRHNVIGHVERGAKSDEKIILLSAHMDTYPASDEEALEFSPRLEGGYLIGRGSADAKGSLAAMLTAFVSTLKSPSRRESYVVASIDEEYGLCGCRTLCTHGMRPHLAITGEPTSLVPIYAQKGIVRASVYISGQVDHAAYPGPENAVFNVGRVLSAMEDWNRALRETRSDHDLGSTTVTPTKVESGGDMNKTPEGVRVWFDARLVPGTTTASFLSEMTTYLEGRVGDIFRLEEPYFSSPSNQCSIIDPLVQELFSKVASAVGKCEPDVFSYGSEAGFLAEMAGSSLVLGPGDAKYSHGPGERVLVDEVVTAADVYSRILVSSE
ncbi:M20 family metallopeptidase [Variovorax sp. Varisp62]|uniref:M20 family metallopeptidase n=1 Tax=Variovorax sp. Varisp62 TaxID=3243049 RepID=UPI002F203092